MTAHTQRTKLDDVMEEASRALVERRYFDAERIALDSLRRAHAARDFERMARILLPLQEARRQKRDLAIDAGVVHVVDGELPAGKSLQPGCYLVTPPRVGVDGRLLREAADRKKTPVVVVVREPQTREGLWPIVTVGPVTLRTKVKPPLSPGRGRKAKPGRSGKKPAADSQAAADPVPTPEWFVEANETLGDSAIAAVASALEPDARVDALMERLEALPDHEKLHQRLEEAAREAARVPVRPIREKPAAEPIGDAEW